MHCDVTERTAVEEMTGRVVAEHGTVDILVNSAGTAFRSPAEDFPEERLDAILTLNIKGTYLPCQAVGRHMLSRGRGSIINLASIGGFSAFPQASAYVTSKGAVVQLTRAFAVEWIARGVRVNGIAPCSVDGPLRMSSRRSPRSRATSSTGRCCGRLLLRARPDRGGPVPRDNASSRVTGHTTRSTTGSSPRDGSITARRLDSASRGVLGARITSAAKLGPQSPGRLQPRSSSGSHRGLAQATRGATHEAFRQLEHQGLVIWYPPPNHRRRGHRGRGPRRLIPIRLVLEQFGYRMALEVGTTADLAEPRARLDEEQAAATATSTGSCRRTSSSTGRSAHRAAVPHESHLAQHAPRTRASSTTTAANATSIPSFTDTASSSRALQNGDEAHCSRRSTAHIVVPRCSPRKSRPASALPQGQPAR